MTTRYLYHFFILVIFSLCLMISVKIYAATADTVSNYDPAKAETAELLAMYHAKKGKVKEILLINLVPAAVSGDSTLIIASPIDYAVWTEYDQKIIDKFIQLAKSKTSGVPEIWIEGLLSASAGKELDARGVKSVDLAFQQLLK